MDGSTFGVSEADTPRLLKIGSVETCWDTSCWTSLICTVAVPALTRRATCMRKRVVQDTDAEIEDAPPAPPKTQKRSRHQRRRSSVPHQSTPSGRAQVVVTISSTPGSDPSFSRPLAVPPLSSHEGIAAFGDYKIPDHSWQKLRQRLSLHACRFDTSEFDSDSKASQRTSPMTRVKGYWSNFRGFGPDDADLGFSLRERGHWIPPKAERITFPVTAGNLENMDWAPARKVRTKDLDSVTPAWSKYVGERNKCSDRLRAKVVPYIWNPGGAGELMCRSGNTFVPCNSSAPLFVPDGSSRVDVDHQVVPSSSLQLGELSPEWVVEFGDARVLTAAAEASTSATSALEEQASDAFAASEDSDLLDALARVAVTSDPDPQCCVPDVGTRDRITSRAPRAYWMFAVIFGAPQCLASPRWPPPGRMGAVHSRAK
ncbi:hypothetical protein ON010_g12532 [Phytophthora cinnamomi]|nr:hypothetical protein ON010_g12532 [Phytophthora cinnamomi]